MSNTIQPGYGAQTYSAPAKARETKQTGTQGNSFLDMAARTSERKNDVFEVNGTEVVQQKAELCPKKLSCGALSQQFPLRDIERRSSLCSTSSINLQLV